MERIKVTPRRIAAGIGLAAAIALGAEACCGQTKPTQAPEPTKIIIPSSSPTGEATPTLKITPSPSPTIEITPSPIVGFSQTEKGITYTTEKGEVLNVPDLSKYGLTAKLKDGTAIYVDAKGARAGEFIPFVTEQQADGNEKQTGGVGLIPSIVSKLISEKISTIPAGQDKVAIPVPLDITNATKDTSIIISYTTGFGLYEAPIARVSFAGTLTLINPFSTTKTMIVRNSYYGWGMLDGYRLENPPTHLNSIEPDNAQRYITVCGIFDGFTEPVTLGTPFGGKIASTESPLIIALSSSQTFDPVETKMLHVHTLNTSASSATEIPVFLDQAKAA